MSKFKTFKDLHYAKDLLVLPNVWNAESASLVEQNGFSAIATSSSAVAAGFGYGDGEQMPFKEYLFMVGRIAATIKLPLTVDLEMGYGKTPDEIFANVSALATLGVVGINFEDSHFVDSKRKLQDVNVFAKKLEGLKNKMVANGTEVYVNLRCDTYLLNVENKRNETATRAQIYESSGADGLFLPCITTDEDIRAAVESTHLPLNVMAYPGLPDFDTLTSLGVKRLSLGGFLFDNVYGSIKNMVSTLRRDKSIKSLVSS
jgi:2-methylisocitrate lyase-like PEP mutase family enzyme